MIYIPFETRLFSMNCQTTEFQIYILIHKYVITSPYEIL